MRGLLAVLLLLAAGGAAALGGGGGEAPPEWLEARLARLEAGEAEVRAQARLGALGSAWPAAERLLRLQALRRSLTALQGAEGLRREAERAWDQSMRWLAARPGEWAAARAAVRLGPADLQLLAAAALERGRPAEALALADDELRLRASEALRESAELHAVASAAPALHLFRHRAARAAGLPREAAAAALHFLWTRPADGAGMGEYLAAHGGDAAAGPLDAPARDLATELRDWLASAAALDESERNNGLLDSFVAQVSRRADDLRGALEAELDAAPLPDGGAACPPTPRAIERRSNLSYAEFVSEYAAKGRPVILTDLAGVVSPHGAWTAEGVRAACGSSRIDTLEYGKDPDEWGQMTVASEGVRIGEVIDRMLAREEGGGGGKDEYLFDVSVPGECPRLLRNFGVPKYFAQDLLQAVPLPESRRTSIMDNYPSMFVGGRGTRCGVHRDSHGTSFFMALYQGRKRWRVFDRKAGAYLYENDRGTAFPDVDVNGDCPWAPERLRRQPLLRKAREMAYEAVLEAGEVIFIPSLAPHAVENLEPIVAASVNYVDHTNLDTVCEQTAVEAGDPEIDVMREHLCGAERQQALRDAASMDPPHASWTDFKTSFGRRPLTAEAETAAAAPPPPPPVDMFEEDRERRRRRGPRPSPPPEDAAATTAPPTPRVSSSTLAELLHDDL